MSASPLGNWRSIACELHGVQECLHQGLLSPQFDPADVARLRKKQPFTPAHRGVFAFLLHVLNSANRFDLGETQRWDIEHLSAFIRWASSKSTGHPCHYFLARR